MRKVDLTGKRFGMLTVQREAPKYISPKGYEKTMWHCRCDCGQECDVMSSHLISLHTQSCGCQKLHGLVAPKAVKNLIGHRFGMLTVMHRMPNRMVGKNSRVVWHCRCDCGNETDVLGLLLTAGQTKSCGCLSISHAERVLKQYLNQTTVNFDMQYHPKGLTGIHGGALFYDCVIYDEMFLPKVLIELDGIQHYQPVSYFGGESKYRECIAHDVLKSEWAEMHNIPLIRIDVSCCTTDASFVNCYDKAFAYVLN